MPKQTNTNNQMNEMKRAEGERGLEGIGAEKERGVKRWRRKEEKRSEWEGKRGEEQKEAYKDSRSVARKDLILAERSAD